MKKIKKYLIKNKKLSIVLVVFVEIILILGCVVFVQLYLIKSIQKSKVVYIRPTPTATPAPTPEIKVMDTNGVREGADRIEPLVKNDSILTTPIMNIEGQIQRMEFRLLPGWKFKDWNFQVCYDAGAVCDYNISIVNASNPTTTLGFGFIESEFDICSFKPITNKNSAYQVYLPSYKTLETEFGTLRVGQAETSSGKSHYDVCQQIGRNDEWIDYTEIGHISAGSTDEKLQNEMLQMIQNIKITKYVAQ